METIEGGVAWTVFLSGAGRWLPFEETNFAEYMDTRPDIAVNTVMQVGLLSSNFHLGHPERAWRAMSQQRFFTLATGALFLNALAASPKPSTRSQLYYGEEAAQEPFAAGICAKFAIKLIDGHLRR